jgi:hypothetical protein
MDIVLKCGMARYKSVQSVDIPYVNIHECAKTRYEKCLSGDDQT